MIKPSQNVKNVNVFVIINYVPAVMARCIIFLIIVDNYCNANCSNDALQTISSLYRGHSSVT